MGIVFKQSLKNTVITYLGFAIGAINHLFLFTRFLTDEYFGLVTVLLSASAVLMPLIAFGVPNTLVKFYSGFKENSDVNSFLTLMLLLPLLIAIVVFGVSYVAYSSIGEFLSRTNPIVKNYVWYIFLIGLAMAYFEIFYAWARVHLKSVFGNFMKEIFVRAGTLILLVLIYLDSITVEFFLKSLVGLYIARMIIMKLYAFSLRMPKLDFNWPEQTRKILSYTTLIILGGSAAIILLEIDKVMLNQFIAIENVAYYGVATYIAMVIIVPSRSMHQITYPLTSELMNARDTEGMKTLYQKSSLTLFMASGILFLLIVSNVAELYLLLPEVYRGGFTVVFIVGLIKVYDSLLGNNNAILYNSEYYRTVLVMGVLLAIITILFNLWLIPEYGIEGAAIASFMAFFIYNTVKLIYVKVKFGMLPFTGDTLKVFMLLLAIGIPFYFVDFSFHPIINIGLKSIPMVFIFVYVIYRFKISEDVNSVIDSFFKRN
ncbi:MAG: oligosaccharide flippase family protein [Maribacter sp.]|uniref:lipopolysaccharide biosynthesis protein n=1 Tax=Maribacter sp. TaxID=1897614 RepID=UPI0032984458